MKGDHRQAYSYNCQLSEYLYRFRGIFCWKAGVFRVKAVTRQRRAA